jgi:pimeloyl-ACP methyl ester carboxylesterase
VSTYLLIPGAGGSGFYWSPVVPLLEAAGHRAIAIDLPADDPRQGLPEYVDLVARAAEGAQDIVVVAQSMGAFTALPACERLNAQRLVLLNAMIPLPGETAGEWWEATGSEPARRAAARAGGYSEDFELWTYFLHDVPPDVIEESGKHQRDEADIAFEQPCEFARWPETTVLAGEGDRFFPVDFQRRLARERVGVEAITVPGGHLAALSQPEAVAAAIASAAWISA